ncbi:pentapeptide repeat-containing protein [Planotetraspora sp. GP83]
MRNADLRNADLRNADLRNSAKPMPKRNEKIG